MNNNTINSKKENYYVNFMKAENYFNNIISNIGKLESLKELKKESKYGNPWAIIRLAECYIDGILDNSDEYIEKGIEILKSSLTKEIPYAQYILASYYIRNSTNKNEIKQAKKLIKKAANGGLADAQFELGSYYEFSAIFNKNLKKAFFYYKMAAKKGHKEAQQQLILCYKKGIGVKKNPHKVKKWTKIVKNYENSELINLLTETQIELK